MFRCLTTKKESKTANNPKHSCDYALVVQMWEWFLCLYATDWMVRCGQWVYTQRVSEIYADLRKDGICLIIFV